MLDSTIQGTVPHQATPWLAFAALFAGNLFLAIGPWMVRMTTADGAVGPVAAGFWRLLLAAPILLLLTRVTRQPIGRMSPRLWLTIGIAGLMFAGDLSLWHIAILKTKLANATLFANISSLLFPLYGFLIARSWPSRTQGVAMLLAAIGALFLLGRSYELSAQNLKGDILCLLAGSFYCLYLIAIDRARGVVKPWPLITLSTIGGILPMLLATWIVGEPLLPREWGMLVGMMFVSQIFGQGLMIYAMGYMKPIVIGLTFLSQPIIAALIGWMAYGETMTPLDIVGAVAIAVALVLVTTDPSRDRARKSR